MANLFITGISGCIGHYLFDRLVKHPDYHLYLLVRTPANLKFDYKAYPNVTLIKDNLEHIEKYPQLLKKMDYLVHLAAGWGRSTVNYDYTLNLFNLLDPNRCRKVIYFSSASILDSNNQPIEGLEKIGTPYIRGKYQFYKKLPDLKIYPKVTTLFLTWVFGGNLHRPYSHASQGIRKNLKWLWLLRFLNLDIAFHFIHAEDAARIAEKLLKQETPEKMFVLGNPATSGTQLIESLCRQLNRKIPFQIKLSPSFIKMASAFSGRKLSEWDKLCLERRAFIYQVADASAFGIDSQHRSIEEVLRELIA